MVTPTVVSPYGTLYVESAAMLLFCGVVGLASLFYSLLVGGLPVIFVAALIFGIWQLSQRRIAQPGAAPEPPPATTVRELSENMNTIPTRQAPADGGGR